MFTKVLKSFSPKPFSGIRPVFKTHTTPLRSFCTNPPQVDPSPEEEFRASLKEGSANLAYLRNYFLSLYGPFSRNLCIIAPASYAFTLLFPQYGTPFFSLAWLSAFALQFGAMSSFRNTQPIVNVETTTTNSIRRKLNYTVWVLGQGLLFAFISKAGFFAPSLLPVALIGCLSSNIGQAIYFKYIMKSGFSPKSLFTWGMLTGSLGMGLVGSGLLAPFGIAFPPDNWICLSLGIIPYNLLTMNTCRDTFNFLAKGTEDPFREVGWLSSCWNSFFYLFFIVYFIKKARNKDEDSQGN